MSRRRSGADSTRWRRRADAQWRRSLDAVVLLPADADEPVTLPGTGALVWDLLEVPATLDELVETLAEVFGADPAVVARDVEALLVRLDDMVAIEACG